MYKIKLQHRDCVNLTGLSDDQFENVINRFMDDGVPRVEFSSNNMWREGFKYACWGNDDCIRFTNDFGVYGRVLNYHQVMEKEMSSEKWYENNELPPVGEECLFFNKNTGVWCHGKVIAYNGLGCCWFEGEGIVSCENPDSFKPVKSDRDNTTDAVNEWAHKKGWMINQNVYSELYLNTNLTIDQAKMLEAKRAMHRERLYAAMDEHLSKIDDPLKRSIAMGQCISVIALAGFL